MKTVQKPEKCSYSHSRQRDAVTRYVASLKIQNLNAKISWKMFRFTVVCYCCRCYTPPPPPPPPRRRPLWSPSLSSSSLCANCVPPPPLRKKKKNTSSKSTTIKAVSGDKGVRGCGKTKRKCVTRREHSSYIHP